MNIEEIKKEVNEWAKNSPTVISKYNRLYGAKYAIDTYYTPLAESHRELVEMLEGIEANYTKYVGDMPFGYYTALSNAKKLLNETE